MKLKKGISHNNLFDRELFTFTTLSEETNGAYSEMRITLQEGGTAGAAAPLHIHPTASEIFTVIKGKIEVETDKGIQIVEVGNTLTVPPNTPHVFRNAHKGETIVDIRFTPAANYELFFANFSAAREQHPEWFKNGKVPIYFFAKLETLYPNVMYFPKVPIGLQRMAFRLIYSIGKLFFGTQYMPLQYE